jgi:hypothetical protein
VWREKDDQRTGFRLEGKSVKSVELVVSGVALVELADAIADDAEVDFGSVNLYRTGTPEAQLAVAPALKARTGIFAVPDGNDFGDDVPGPRWQPPADWLACLMLPRSGPTRNSTGHPSISSWPWWWRTSTQRQPAAAVFSNRAPSETAKKIALSASAVRPYRRSIRAPSPTSRKLELLIWLSRCGPAC